MPYIGKSPTGSGVRTRYYFTATGGETSLSGADDGGKALTFSDGEYVDVYLNGVALVAGTDYGTATANTIGGLAALSGGDIVEVVVYDIYNVAKINSEAVRTRHYYTATGGETSIGTAQIPGLSFPGGTEIEVSLNGISLVQGTDYNTTAANTIGGLSALSAGNVVAVVLYDKFQLADTVSKAQGGAFSGPVTADGGLNVGTIKEVTGTTTAMTIDSTGRVLQPAKPFFHVSESNNTGAVGITGQLAFDTVVTNIGSHYDTAGFFKAPVAGIYQFNFSGMGCGDVSGGALPSNQSVQAILQKATDDAFTTGLVSFASGFSQVVSSTSFPNISVSGSILLAANDRVRAVMGNNYVFASTNAIYDPQFSGYLVG